MKQDPDLDKALPVFGEGCVWKARMVHPQNIRGMGCTVFVPLQCMGSVGSVSWSR